MNRVLRVLVVLVVVSLGFAESARAQMSYGVRGGISAEPKQFFVGMHLESAPLTKVGPLTFRPNVEVGFGDSTTLLSGNLEVVYWVRFPGSKWQGYFGAGPSAVYIHNGARECFAADGCGNNQVAGGFNGLVGFQHDSGLFLELKRGDGGNPSLRMTVGYVLKKRK